MITVLLEGGGGLDVSGLKRLGAARVGGTALTVYAGATRTVTLGRPDLARVVIACGAGDVRDSLDAVADLTARGLPAPAATYLGREADPIDDALPAVVVTKIVSPGT